MRFWALVTALFLAQDCNSWVNFWQAGLNLTSMTPANGSTGNAVFTSVALNFNQTLEASTFNSSSVSFSSAAGSVDATMTLSGSTITLKPKAYLAAGTEYSIRITTDLKGAGNTSFSETSTFKFSTIAESSYHSHVGTAGASEQIKSVARFSDGSYVLAGYMLGAVTAIQATSGISAISGLSYTGGGTNDCFVARLSPNGTVQWYAHLGSSSGSDICNKVIVTKNDEIVIGGKFGNGAPNIASIMAPKNAYSAADDMFVARFTATGQLVWWSFFGGGGTDDILGLAEDFQGNIIASGFAGSPGMSSNLSKQILPAQGGLQNTIILKLSADGTLQWYTHIGDPAGSAAIVQDALAVGSDGYIMTAGPISMTLSNYSGIASAITPYATAGEGFIVRHSPTGQAQWYTFFGGTGNQNLKAGIADEKGNFIFVGDSTATFIFQGLTPETAFTAGTDAVIYSISPAGVPQWFQFFGGSGTDNPINIQAAADGGFAVLTSSASLFSFGGKSLVFTSGGGLSDFVIARYNSNRQFLWHTSMGSTGFDQPYGLVESFDGGWFTAGSTDTNINGIGGRAPLYAYVSGGDGLYAKVKSNGGF